MRSLALIGALLGAPGFAQNCDPDTSINGTWNWTPGPGTMTTGAVSMAIKGDEAEPVSIEMDGEAGVISSVIYGEEALIEIQRITRDTIDFDAWSRETSDGARAAFDAAELAALTACDLEAMSQYKIFAEALIGCTDMTVTYDVVRLSDDLLRGYAEAELVLDGQETVIRRTVTFSR